MGLPAKNDVDGMKEQIKDQTEKNEKLRAKRDKLTHQVNALNATMQDKYKQLKVQDRKEVNSEKVTQKSLLEVRRDPDPKGSGQKEKCKWDKGKVPASEQEIDKVTQKLNDTCTDIRNKKEDINSLRKKLVIINRVCRNLTEEIDNLEKMIRSDNGVQRKHSKTTEGNLRKMTKLQAENEENQAVQVSEMKELRAQMGAKTKSYKKEMRTIQQSFKGKMPRPPKGGEIDSSIVLGEACARQQGRIAKKKENYNQKVTSVNKIKVNFNNILQQKGTTDINEVVKHFQMSEEQTEQFETQLSNLENEIESLKKENKGLEDSLATLTQAKETTRSSKDKENSLVLKLMSEEKALESRKEETQDKENAIKLIGEAVKAMLLAFDGAYLASMASQKHQGADGDVGHKNIGSLMTVLEELLNDMLNQLCADKKKLQESAFMALKQQEDTSTRAPVMEAHDHSKKVISDDRLKFTDMKKQTFDTMKKKLSDDARYTQQVALEDNID